MSKRKSRKSAANAGPHRDRNRPDNAARQRRVPVADGDNGIWIYGRHAALAAIANERRVVRRVLVTNAVAEDCADELPRECTDVVDRDLISDLLNPGEVHQGIAVLAAALPDIDLADVCDMTAGLASACVIVLDQATDPRNVGAVIRSAAAFGAAAVIVHDRHAPPARGALAKAASGALERIPLVEVGNLARALSDLKDAGFWCLGFDGDAPESLSACDMPSRVALIFGAEGSGMRRLTGENCDLLARIPMDPEIASLNLANAAAIGLYEWRRRLAV